MRDDEHFPVIVLAASAGGVFALESLVGALAPDFPAALLVALHLNPRRATRVPTLLARKTALPVTHPDDGEPIRKGHIYIAPPDQHMVVAGGCIRLTGSAPEAHQRPAADPLFRSAAAAFSSRVIGVVLTGGGDDGSRGVIAIKKHGGRTLAQWPGDARFGFMPASAIATGSIDYCLPLEQIPLALEQLCRGEVPLEVAVASVCAHRILVVEDEYILAREMTRMLEELGYQVVGPAANAADGMRLLRDLAAPIDCALLDVNLGAGPVYPLALALRDARVPMIFATGYGVESLDPEWRQATHLQKPFELPALRGALSKVTLLPAIAADRAGREHSVGAVEEQIRQSRDERMISRTRLAKSKS